MKFLEVQYLDIEENKEYEMVLNRVINKCFEEEKLKNLYISITLTNPENIQKINKEYRNIDRATDVLSFPMFEREEIPSLKEEDKTEDILGDIIVSIEKVKEQAEEYGHSFERELAYLVTHGMLHLLGYDHMIDEEKVIMRKREEEILGVLNITRD